MAGDQPNPNSPSSIRPMAAPAPVAVPDRDRAWVAPELPADELGVGAGGPLGTATAGGRVVPSSTAGERPWSDRPPPSEPPLVPTVVRPLSVADRLDGGWAVITRRPGTVFGLSALLVVPAEVAAAVLLRGSGRALDIGTLVLTFFPFLESTPSGRTASWEPASVGAVAVLSLAYLYLGVAVSHLVGAWYRGEDPTTGQAAARALRASPAVLAVFAVLLVPKVLSILLLVVPAVLVFPLVWLVAPVLAIERTGPLAAIRRSARLVGRRYPAVVGVWLLALVVERVVDLALQALPDLVADLVPAELGEVLRAAGWAVALFVTAPTVAGVAAVVYLDLRVRTEGLDLELEARDAFPVA